MIKQWVTFWVIAIPALTARATLAEAATISDFDCSRKVVAIYQPGPNWSQFRELLSVHLDFVKAKMDEKAMAFGSPMSDRSGQPIGGLFVYNATNLDAVEKFVQEDAFVRDRVVVYRLGFWGMCQGKTSVR
jgi:uncharacterized protein YciI